MNNYLLQTDNYTPLVDLIAQLHGHIARNDALIAHILTSVDSFALSNAKQESSDELRYFLDSKYHLDSMPDVVNEGPYTDLMNDIHKLTNISTKNQQVNLQLFEIIKTYEIFITTNLVPQLRADSERIMAVQTRDFRRVCEFKHELTSKTYEKYQIYIEYLERLKLMFEKLGKMVEQMDGMAEVEEKLEAIDVLVAEVSGRRHQ